MYTMVGGIDTDTGRATRIAEEIDVVFEERSGDAADGVIAVADAYDADLLCVAGREQTPVGKAVFGNVTQEILLETDKAVLVYGN